MECGYKFRIYPNKSQIAQIVKTFGCCRFVYNHFLVEREEYYAKTGKNLTFVQQSRDLTVLKKQLVWLQEVDITALQSSLRALDSAYSAFFRGISGGHKANKPAYKKKHNTRQSYTSKCFDSIRFSTIRLVGNNHVRLPKLGLVKCRVSRKVTGRILSATISVESSGRYYVSLCCTDSDLSPLPKTGNNVGIDVGISELVVTSDGEVFDNKKFLRKSQKAITKLSRELSRKTRGSSRWEKTRLRLAKLHEHVRNQRLDMLHKLSASIIERYDVIVIEDLAIAGLLKNHNLSYSISDASWHELRRQLSYKADWYGRSLVIVDRMFPSSQLCSCCGTKWVGARDLRIRRWTCAVCGAIHDRDLNAAVNILNEGLKQIH